MPKPPSRRPPPTDLGLLVLRAGFALLLFGLHGWPRLVSVWNHFVHGQPWGFINMVDRLGFPSPIVFALLSSFAESIAALCVGLGLWTRAAAFLIVINMSVAFWSEATGGDPIERPGLYLLVALTLVITGSGRLALRPRP